MAERNNTRCYIPGKVAPPSGPTTYPARFAKEVRSNEAEQAFLGEDVAVLRQVLRLPINPNYTLGVGWRMKLTGETGWSKIAQVTERFVQDRPRFWIVVREVK